MLLFHLQHIFHIHLYIYLVSEQVYEYLMQTLKLSAAKTTDKWLIMPPHLR